MIDFVIWVIFIGVGICGLVFAAILLLLVYSMLAHISAKSREVLPHPDTSAERMYDINYFYRANGRNDK
jgi:LPS O-antigen subunit length determinant protein (WzzB/FepE family)